MPQSTIAARVFRRLTLVLGCLLVFGSPAGASAASAVKRVSYEGHTVTVPASWPVYRLARDPGVCVRFNRPAVYLGVPAANERCPAHSVGRSEAVLIEPVARRHRAALMTHAPAARSLAGPAMPASVPTATATRALAHAGDVYTGVGFDACSAPSASHMAAWAASPYRAIGVYIGGANMACAQRNLTATWVSEQTAAGWHLIPTYVGLQAPTNSCGCASISPASAAVEGAAAATDAVAQAGALGLGPGNPIYFDMESYPRNAKNTPTVLAFLASWTAQLHASGYSSGVYSSADSGIRDLVAQLGTGYQEPDDLWIARWNNAQNTFDPNVPSTAWPAHQRLHQYSGAHNETYGGVTLNIDGNYLDGATALGVPLAPAVAAAPSLSVSAAPDGGIELHPSWTGVSGISSWQVVAGSSPTALTAAATAAAAAVTNPIVIHSAYPYFAVQALGSTAQVLGTSPAVATPPHLAIFGQSAFVAAPGTAALPVACFKPTPCHVSTTVSVGRKVIATTGREQIPSGGGLAYFKLTPPGRQQLAHASGRRLAVTVTIRDVTGLRVTRQLTLISFTTVGTGPRRLVRQGSGVSIVGTTEFVSHGWTGGILAACVALAPCHLSAVISAQGRPIAWTAPEFLGVGQFGYLLFTLTAAGHRMLMQNADNQLSARVRITPTGGSSAVANVSLVWFG
jgi:hypothetical protein